MMKVFFPLTISILLISNLFAKESGCIDGKIRYLQDKKEIIQQDRYCYDSLLHSISSLKKCADQKECLINMPGPYPMHLKEVQGEKGSVGFKICEKLKGTPQFIEFWDSEKWNKTSRCLFEDGSYMDIPALSLKVKYVD